MTEEPVEFPPLTPEEVEKQHQLLLSGIAVAEEWFNEALSPGNFESYSDKEKKLSRVLDPILWLMREAALSYEHECEDCSARIQARQNGLALTLADMLTFQEEGK